MPRAPLPTDAELAILAVLWSRGPSTVREVHEELHGGEGMAYTTTLKLMQLMAQKGHVARDESRRSHVYRAVRSEAQTQKGLIRNLAEKAFAGSATQLALRALSTKPVSPAELTEIRRLLDDLEGER